MKRVSGNFSIAGNIILKTLMGFDLLEEVNGNCGIGLPPLLVTENHFSNLKIIKGELTTNYTHFHQLDSVGELKIWEDILDKDTLSGFASLKNAGTLSIRYNENLQHIEAFENLETIHSILIEFNNRLTSITSFNKLILIEDDFHLIRNPKIETLNTFNQLKEIKNYILIDSNDNLETISGFNQLVVADSVYINSNEKLEIIPEFSNIKKLSTFNITSNRSLKKIAEYNNLFDIYYLSILSNTNLAEIDGFKNLNQNNTIAINDNNNLLRIDAFNQLRNISNISIRNRNLRVFNAFEKLVSIERLRLSANIQLRSIDNFSNLSNISNQLYVRDNLQLNQCCLINCWLEEGVLDTLTNSASIYNNGSDCMNLSAIKSACETTNCTNNQSAIRDIRLGTNPVSESLQFLFILKEDQLINYTIYSINDQLVARGAVNGIQGFNRKTISLPSSQKGHYFLVLHNEQAKEVVKFIQL